MANLIRQVESMAQIPLSALPEGSEAIIAGFSGGAGFAQKLADMGLVPGTRIKVVKNQRNGPMMIWVRGVTLGIGRGVSMKVLVQPVNQ